MKTAVHRVVEVINIALFLLTATVWGPCAILATSLLSWWFLSDCYFACWSWWSWPMDRVGFIVFTLFILLAFAVVIRWRLRSIARDVGPQYEDFRGASGGPELPLRAWYQHLALIATFQHGLWARYWTWRRSRLESLRDSSARVDARSLATLWWPRWAGLAPWSMAALFPVLWVVLILIPLHTNAMEYVAGWVSVQDPEISAVRCTGRVGRSGAVVDELLEKTPSGFYRRGQCVFVGSGTFEITSSAFPRVYRYLQVSCAERCGVAPERGVNTGPDLVVACACGRASFEWVPRDSDLQGGLGMAVTLVRQDKRPLASALIEPAPIFQP